MHEMTRPTLLSIVAAAACALAPYAPLAAAQPGDNLAASFFAPRGSQSNGVGDFETEVSSGQIFTAQRSGELVSLDLVLSDFSDTLSPDLMLQRDVEIRVYEWVDGDLGGQLANVTVPHEEIPDGLQFSNYTVETVTFDAGIMLERCQPYAFLVSLNEFFGNPPFGRIGVLGLARNREGPIYRGGEVFRHNADGSVQVFNGTPNFGNEGTLDFFFRVNLLPDGLGNDLNTDGNLDFFDAVEYLSLFDAGNTDADIDGAPGLTAGDPAEFLLDIDGCY